LPVGMAPVDLEKVCDGVAHALEVRECRVKSAQPGRVWLEVHHRDVLQSVVPPIAREVPANLGASQSECVKTVNLGACDSPARTFSLLAPLARVKVCAVVAASGSWF